MSEMRWVNGLGVGLFAALLGCSASSAAPADPALDDNGYPVVMCPADTPMFAAGPQGIGLTAMGQNQTIQARIIAAMPLTPQRFENDWSVAVMDAQGTPLDDAEITSACAWMPVHGHSEPAQSIVRLADPSSFQLKALNLAMRGPWEVQLTVKSPHVGGTPTLVTRCDQRMSMPGTDLIVLRACIADQ